MRIIGNRRIAARFIFIIGLLLMFLGSAFLIGTRTEISQFSILVSFCFVTAGLGLAALAIRLNKRSLYLFFGAFFFQTGLFLFLSILRVIPISFSQAWPLVSVFSGLALFPAGWHRFGAVKAHYAAPSLAFVLLGSLLLVFSLDMVQFSLAQFIRNWWPLLVALAGLTLMVIAAATKNSGDAKK